jgi:hypothetical protein
MNLPQPHLRTSLESAFFAHSVLSNLGFQFPKIATGLVLVLLLLADVHSGVAQRTSVSPGPPFTQTEVPGISTGRRTLPTVSNGYIVSFSREASATTPNSIVLTSLSTGHRQTIQLDLKQPETFVEDAAVGTAGVALLVGSYLRARDGEVANFLAALDPNGLASFSIELGSYAPERVCGAVDGTIWTLGQEWPKEQDTPNEDYALLRHYTADGALAASYLMRSTLPRDIAVNFHNNGVVTPAFLSCGAQSVGVYTAVEGVGYWIELPFDSTVPQVWVVTAPTPSRVTGLSLVGQHAVYASIIHQQKRELYTLTLQEGHEAMWTPVVTSVASDKSFTRLLGRDGSALVYAGTGAEPGDRVLKWTQP